jgi:hypothetical protein
VTSLTSAEGIIKRAIKTVSKDLDKAHDRVKKFLKDQQDLMNRWVKLRRWKREKTFFFSNPGRQKRRMEALVRRQKNEEHEMKRTFQKLAADIERLQENMDEHQLESGAFSYEWGPKFKKLTDKLDEITEIAEEVENQFQQMQGDEEYIDWWASLRNWFKDIWKDPQMDSDEKYRAWRAHSTSDKTKFDSETGYIFCVLRDIVAWLLKQSLEFKKILGAL